MSDIEKVRKALEIVGEAFTDEKEIAPYKSLKLNTYQEYKLFDEAITELERLQKKEVPMKLNGDINDWGCKVCDSTINYQYPRCPFCGQRLDWGDESE